MSFLLVNLLVLAVVAAAAVLAYSQMLRAEADEWMAPGPGIDYAALQAHWRGLTPARDWDSLRAQVRRWQEASASGAEANPCDEVARNLNEAVFRFAVPGEPLVPRRTAADDPAVERTATAHCPARLRARAPAKAWPAAT